MNNQLNMQIKCDKCNAVYSIAESVIGPSGRKVKCAKCDYIWQVNLPKDEPFNLKPEIHGHYITWVLKSLSIVLFALICYVGFTNFPTISSNLLSISNLYNKVDFTGITLEEVKYKIVDDDLIITGKFINSSDEEKSLPSIHYAILDENKKVIFSEKQEFLNKQLSPDEAYKINAKIINLSPKAAYLQLDVGNQLNFTFKKAYSLLHSE